MLRLSLCCLLLIGHAALAQESQPDLRKKYTELRKELTATVTDYNRKLKNAATEQEKTTVRDEFTKIQDSYHEKYLQLALATPKDEAAEDIFIFLSGDAGPRAGKAFAMLIEHFPKSTKLGTTLAKIKAFSPEMEVALNQISLKGETPELKGQANLALARGQRLQAEKLFQGAQFKESGLAWEAALAKVKQAQEDLKTTKIGKLAADARFELEQLTVGKIAPEIDGEDIDGKRFKLSDHRGKITVICFWGNWCAPCRAMYEHEKSLVKRMTDKPFILLGVNSDKDRDGVKKVLESNNMTWRSFWNGGGTGGPISKLYRVRSWPTIYVLDERGMIRYRNVRGEAMDRAVDALLKEIEAKTQP